MTTKRTNGPCTEECMAWRTTHRLAVNNHLPDCPSIYPAQHEPDALTRLARYVRSSTLHEVEKEEALSLVAEAREEQRMHVETKARLEAADDTIRNLKSEVARLRRRLDMGPP